MRLVLQSTWTFLIVPLLGLTLGGCGSHNVIPFERVSHGGLRTPGVHVIDSAAAWQTLLPELRGTGEVPDIAWDKEFVIGVFLGERPTGGYGITVEELRRIGSDGIEVIVQTVTPKPDDFVTMAFTYPGHLIRVDRRWLPRETPRNITVRNRRDEMLFQEKADQQL